jgi:hypothetical protein
MHFDGAFNLPGTGAGTILTSSSGTSFTTPSSSALNQSTRSPTTSQNMKDYSLA